MVNTAAFAERRSMHLMNGAIVVLSAGIRAQRKDFKETVLIGWKWKQHIIVFPLQGIKTFFSHDTQVYFPTVNKATLLIFGSR